MLVGWGPSPGTSSLATGSRRSATKAENPSPRQGRALRRGHLGMGRVRLVLVGRRFQKTEKGTNHSSPFRWLSGSRRCSVTFVVVCPALRNRVEPCESGSSAVCHLLLLAPVR